MAEELVMPRLSDTMEEGTISRWLKREGETIKRGEPVAEIETDKANMEFESYLEGVLSKIIVHEGETAPLGAVIAMVSAEGEVSVASPPTGQASAATASPTVASPTAASPTAATTAPVPTSPAQEKTREAPPSTAPATRAAPFVGREAGGQDHDNGRTKASPLARKIATEHGVDIGSIRGTGPGGRVIREDVEAHLTTDPTSAADTQSKAGDARTKVTTTPLTSMQRVIAKRMVESKTTVPHFYVTSEVAMDEAMGLRVDLNQSLGGGKETDVTINSFVAKAAALALSLFPDVNGSFQGDHFELHDAVNVGVAVALDKGLVVPVVRNADTKSVREIDREVRALARKAREGKLALAELQGGTFSISNLGPWDVDEFQAIVDPPQAGILAIGTVREKPVVVDGQVTIGKRMRVTLSADHRILYGVPGAQFLQEVKRLLEHPLLLGF